MGFGIRVAGTWYGVGIYSTSIGCCCQRAIRSKHPVDILLLISTRELLGLKLAVLSEVSSSSRFRFISDLKLPTSTFLFLCSLPPIPSPSAPA